MGKRLRDAGVSDFTIFEAADDLGGTWRDNTYPGCACDVKSHMYSFSFDLNPRWTRAFSPQAEIWEYMEATATRHGLRPHIRFGTRIARADFDDARGGWVLRTTAGETLRARTVVAGTGPLTVPSYPSIPGRERFEGPAFHSARWDHGVDLGRKRVAVVGTGASAIQIIPSIAPIVDQLYVFQRTPAWVIPRDDAEYSEATKQLFATVPGAMRAYRSFLYLQNEAKGLALIYEPRALAFAEKLVRKHIRRSLPSRALAEKLTPRYRMGCKRILLSDDYYQAFARDNVELVTDRVTEIDAHRVTTADGASREVDAIVWATGFEVQEYLAPMQVFGRGGEELHEKWRRDGAEAYLGIAVAGFPSFYTFTGPNTGLGHNSMIFVIESQAEHILRCIELERREDLAWLDVRADVQRDYNALLQKRLAKTVWATGCKSWYLDDQGRNFTLWPGTTVEYFMRCHRPRFGSFTRGPKRAALSRPRGAREARAPAE
jgi:cation diffusion facilitator CzcD-associated flavoprotein CzcO